MTGIYKITSPTGKVYIGQSRDIDNRWKYYKRFDCKGQIKLYNSLKNYGTEKHQFQIIHELPPDVTQEVLNNYEILYWQLYKDCGVEMLNLREPGKGGKLTKETKDKISKANKGKKHSDETKLKMSLAQMGSKHSEETKSKISQSKKGTRKGNKNRLGKHHSEESKIKISESNKGENGFWFGKKHSQKTKDKMSLAAKKRWNDHV